jgi:hypothetical protein
MKNMKKIIIIATVFLVIAAILVFRCCFTTLPVPEVKEGRFEFSVTYEINGEAKTYSGVYGCRFDGALITLLGSSVEWEDYIENEEGPDLPIHTNEDGTVYINFGFMPEYFMDDPNADIYDAPKPNLYMIFNGSREDDLDITSDEEVIAEYGVRLIGYEYPSPIENTFEEKLTFGRFVPSIN